MTEKTLTDAGRVLNSSQTIVLSTHLLCDGDGLGAEIALYHYLKRLGKNVRIINPDEVPARYQFIDRNQTIEIYSKKTKLPQSLDVWVIVDTGDSKRLGPLWPLLKKPAKQILILDHHPYLHEEDQAHTPSSIIRVVDERSSSIGELLYRLFHHCHDILDPTTTTFRLSAEIALGLYVSVMTDTNSFRYARTTSLSHRIAADLIDFGLQPEEIYQNVYSSKSINHLRLIGEVLSRVNEAPRARSTGECGTPESSNSLVKTVVWVEIPKALRNRFGASSDDTQAIVNFLLLIKNAEILVLLREEDDGAIKVSIKSKGTVAVHKTAQEFGGGGHEFAAGFTTQGSLEDIRKKLISKLCALT